MMMLQHCDMFYFAWSVVVCSTLLETSRHLHSDHF